MLFEYEEAKEKARDEGKLEMFTHIMKKLGQTHHLNDQYGIAMLNIQLPKDKQIKKTYGIQLGHYGEQPDERAGHEQTRKMLMDGKLKMK